MTAIKSCFKRLEQFIFPYTCIFCQLNSDLQQDLCSFCQRDLPWVTNTCYQCGEQLYGDSSYLHCGSCLTHPPPFDRCVILMEYKSPVLALVNQLKFYQKLTYARVLSELLLVKLTQVYEPQALPEFIIPIPLHSKRLAQRGYNQALELAKPLAKGLRIKLSTNSCYKIKATPPQSSLPASERKTNLRGVFKINANFKANHIALIDDVMTTGSTLRALSTQFKRQGVSKIDLWCVARTLKKR